MGGLASGVPAQVERREAALRESRRALRLLSRITGALIRATEESALLDEICAIAVEVAGYPMAWVGLVEHDEGRTVRPVAAAGQPREFLESVRVSWADDEYGHGVAGTAIRTLRPAIGRDLTVNPAFAAWRHVFAPGNFAAAFGVPLLVGGSPYGVLVIYGAEPDAFDDTEVDLLAELGANISHGIASLRARRERAEAAAVLERIREELEATVGQRTRELTVRDRELAESHDRYRELVESSNSIILRLDTSYRVTFFNEFAQRFFGFPADEILGRSVFDTIVPDEETTGRDLRHLIEDVAANPERYASLENENVRRNGERVWIAWTNRPVYDAEGALEGLLFIGNDISALKATERELVVAKEAAEAADRTKSAFLATMSHELRTPLNSIIGFSGILQQGLAGPLNDEQRKQLGMVQSSARHLLDLINDVLDISRIEAGRLDLVVEEFDVAASVDRVIEAVHPLAERKGLWTRREVAGELARFPGDRRRVEQVLLNLVANAVKFTERGGCTVRCLGAADRVVLSVQDTGIGIDAADIPSLFRPFQQVDQGLARRHEGTGLGLSICERLVTMMGGSVRVESRPGAGSTFTVVLPVRRGGAA